MQQGLFEFFFKMLEPLKICENPKYVKWFVKGNDLLHHLFIREEVKFPTLSHLKPWSNKTQPIVLSVGLAVLVWLFYQDLRVADFEPQKQPRHICGSVLDSKNLELIVIRFSVSMIPTFTTDSNIRNWFLIAYLSQTSKFDPQTFPL